MADNIPRMACESKKGNFTIYLAWQEDGRQSLFPLQKAVLHSVYDELEFYCTEIVVI